MSVGEFSIRVFDWRDAAALAGSSVILFDLDLADPAELAAARRMIARTSSGQRLVIAIERGDHFARVQADALRAARVLYRPFDRKALLEALRPGGAEGPAERRRDEALERLPGGSSVVSAATVLRAIFAALPRGGTLESHSLDACTAEVADAIAEVGLMPWLGMVRSHHRGTFQHCLLVTGIAVGLGVGLGIRHADLALLAMSALLHDIGKAEIPLAILEKPTTLTDAEFAVVKRHPVIGHRYLVSRNALDPAILDAVLHHHEYLDGSGYPDGLTGSEIADLTRIITVCDVFGAMLEWRPYKAAKAPAQALGVLTTMAESGKVEWAIVRMLERSLCAFADSPILGDTAPGIFTDSEGWRAKALAPTCSP